MQTLHISPTGSDSLGLGTPSNPFRTVDRALAELETIRDYPHSRAHATLYLARGGTYDPFTLNRDGLSPSQPLTITSYGPSTLLPPLIRSPSTEPGGPPLIELAGLSRQSIVIRDLTLDGSTLFEGIRAINREPTPPHHSHITLSNLTITHCRNGLNLQGLTHLTIHACTIAHCYGRAEERVQGIYLEDAAPLTISNCLLYHNGWDPTNPTTRTIYNQGCYMRQRRRPLSSILITNNIFAHSSSWGLSLSSDEEPVDGPLTSDVTIRYNIFAWNANGFVMGALHPSVHDSPLIEYNTFLALGANPSGIPQAHGIYLKGCTTPTIANNVLHRPATLPPGSTRRPIILDETPASTDPTLTNNHIDPEWQ